MKAPKWNAPKPTPSYGAKNCVFPVKRDKEVRSFQIDEVVCIRVPGKDEPIPARYAGVADAGPGYHRVREGSSGYDVAWYDVGKIPSKISDVMLESVVRQKKPEMPAEIQGLIGEFRGRSRRTRRRLTKRRRRNV